MTAQRTFTPDDVTNLSPENKLALVGTRDPDGLPHLSLLTSLLALDEGHLALGEFSEGVSKRYMQERPETGFLIMTLDRKLWRGTGRWTKKATEGPEYHLFNDKPMFRYNSYFGIHTVHYLDLVSLDQVAPLPLAGIGVGVLSSLPLRIPGLVSGRAGKAKSGPLPQTPMNPWTQALFGRLDTLKFLGVVDPEGYCRIIPVLQTTSRGASHLVLAETPWHSELAAIPDGTTVAVMGIRMNMESVVVRGTYHHSFRLPPGFARIDVNWVYNSMPPAHGVIYP
jgi:hypothetical protein